MADILFVTWDGGGNVPPADGHRRRATTPRPPRPVRRARLASATPLDGAGLRGRADHARAPVRGRRPAVRARDDPDVRRPRPGPRRARRARPTVPPTSWSSTACCSARWRSCAATGTGPARRTSSLEHLYDAFFRRSFLRGPIGIGLRLMRPATRVPPWTRPARPWSPACRRSTRPAQSPRSRRDVRGSGGDGRARRCRGPPAVLVSLSTFAFPGMADCLQRLLDATATLDARVVVTTGPHVDHARAAHGPQPRAARRRAARRADAPGLARGHPRRPRHDDARARPRPAAGGDADAPVRRPAAWSAGRSSGAGAGRMVAKKASADELRAGHRRAAGRRAAPGRGRPPRRSRSGRCRAPPTRRPWSRALLRNGAAAPGRRAARP